MSVTDELRCILDERGVKWDELQSYDGGKMTRWRDSLGRYVTAYDDGVVKFIADFYWQPTAQQAIDATLGRGMCRLVRHGHLNDWPEMVCWSCSVCNFGWHHDVNDKQFSYCPNCGRKVMNI